MQSDKITKIFGLTTGALSALTIATSITIYDKMFSRYERPNYEITAGLCNYLLLKKQLPREELFFPSDDVLLKAYFYPSNHPKGLVIISHGSHAGADDYLPFISFFVKNHFHVFAFDNKGTYDSQGDSTVGMCESLVDLYHALVFLNNQDKYNLYPFFLFGHSWGGYAVCSVLSLCQNIKACASISAFNDAYQLILNKGVEKAGKPALLSKPFLDAYQKYLFGSFTEFTAIDGINKQNTPTLIAHGVEDNIISFKKQSIIAYQDRITNPNVIYYNGEALQSGHNSILYSNSAIQYQNEIAQKIIKMEARKQDKLSYEEKKLFNQSVNHYLYSEVNLELMNQIIQLFSSVL